MPSRRRSGTHARAWTARARSSARRRPTHGRRIAPHARRTFVERLDFRTTVGHGTGPGSRERLGFRGAGPTAVITDLGVLEPDPDTRELTLTAVHPGIEVAAVRGETGWTLRVSDDLKHTEAPTEAELSALRELVSR